MPTPTAAILTFFGHKGNGGYIDVDSDGNIEVTENVTNDGSIARLYRLLVDLGGQLLHCVHNIICHTYFRDMNCQNSLMEKYKNS